MSKVLKKENLQESEMEADLFVYNDFIAATKESSEKKADRAESQEEDIRKQIRDEYDIILDEARRKAQAIMQDVEQASEDIKKKAYEEGYSSGFEAGREEATREVEEKAEVAMREAMNKLADVTESVEQVKAEIVDEYIEQLKDIVVVIADKVIRTGVKSSSGIIKKMIISATEKIKNRAWARIFISSDFGKGELDLEGDADFIKSLSGVSENIKVTVMKEAEPGTCIIELPDQILDISIGTQLKNIKEIIRN